MPSLGVRRPWVYISRNLKELEGTSKIFNEPEDSFNSVSDPILSEVISVLRSSVRSHATHAIGELKNISFAQFVYFLRELYLLFNF